MTDTNQNTANPIIDTVFDMGFSYAISEFVYAFLIVAFFMFCFGFALIAYDLYWRLTSYKVKGELYALLAKGSFKDGISNETFSNIYKYKNKQGITMYAGDNTSSNILGNRLPGKEVYLHIKDDDIHTVHPTSSTTIIWGIGITALACILTYIIFSINEISSAWSWLIVLPPLVAAAPKALDIAKDIKKDWKERKDKPPKKEFTAEEIATLMRYRADNDHYLFREDVIERMKAKDKLTAKDPYVMIGICLFIIALSTYIGHRDFYGGGYFGFGTGPEIFSGVATLIIALCIKSIIKRAMRKNLH